jgi:hypothetical protein
MKQLLSTDNIHISDESDYREIEWKIENINEDIFFTFACEILQKKMPDIEHRKRLSIEFEETIYYDILPTPNNIPAVYHGWNKNYHSIDIAKYFISNYFTIKIVHFLITSKM